MAVTFSEARGRLSTLTGSRYRLLAILPILGTFTALILCFLCLFAGHKANMMEDYSIFTLNTSRIGKNLIEKIDNDITTWSPQINFKRGLEVMPSTPAVPTPTPTLAPRLQITNSFFSSATGAIGGAASSIDSNAHSAVSSAHSAITSAASAVSSDVISVGSSLGSEAASAIQSVIKEVETRLANEVDSVYNGLIKDFHIAPFYSFHVLETCEGYYTPGDEATANLSMKDIHKVITKCTKNDTLNPTTIVMALYIIGIVLTGLCLPTFLIAFWNVKRSLAVINAFLAVPPFFFVGLASGLTTGISVGAAKLITHIGEHIGISAYQGGKFMALTWGATILLFLNMFWWILSAIIGSGHSLKSCFGLRRSTALEAEKSSYPISEPMRQDYGVNGRPLENYPRPSGGSTLRDSFDAPYPRNEI
ncbi:MAG: hypothetical protein M1820_003374 [Bogoriella megaspora]|nr:MAG: hypothetical protein M1820_003374 [Bogoriella megaspora]